MALANARAASSFYSTLSLKKYYVDIGSNLKLR
jgi:hypothetical protein